ncbi:MAG: hypothetical protein EHM62_01930, partial [Methylococcus sp.]
MLDDLRHYPPASWPDLLDHFRRQLAPPPEPGRTRVHFRALTLADGRRITFDADVPADRLPALLASGHDVELLPAAATLAGKLPAPAADPWLDVAVVNMAYTAGPGETVEYIGRPNPGAGLSGSPLANPYP